MRKRLKTSKIRHSATCGTIILPELMAADGTQASINQLAEKWESRVGTDDLPKIIKRYGGRIEYIENETLLDSECGAIEVYGPGKFTIYLSQFTTPLCDRFVLAHEIGHYILHAKCGKTPGRANRKDYCRVEWEANWFASGWLLPEKKFRAAYAADPDIGSLMLHFKVPARAVFDRLKYLGLDGKAPHQHDWE